MSTPINAIIYGRTPEGNWVRLQADDQGRLRCHLFVQRAEGDSQPVDLSTVLIIKEDENP